MSIKDTYKMQLTAYFVMPGIKPARFYSDQHGFPLAFFSLIFVYPSVSAHTYLTCTFH